MSSLHGLPPLPKSLSGFAFFEQKNSSTSSTSINRPSRGASPASSGHSLYSDQHRGLNGTPEGPTPTRKGTNLDAQLAILRREMYSLRQLDLSLLSQLWSLNESIQDFRQILQEQDDRALSPPSASPTPSSCDEADAEEFYSPTPLRLRPAPPPPPLRTTSNSSSANSSEYGTV
ncbi:leucine repeat adapter protein 25 isoform X2 [Agrilus planipennis]|nr:leucine repeat adapter protein 25 isoform X2 [Agrilus planipennis]